MINWKVRLVNKNFWLSLIPAVLLLIQAVGAPLGMTLDFGELGNQLLDCQCGVRGAGDPWHCAGSDDGRHE